MTVFVSLPSFYLQAKKSIGRRALVRDRAILEASAEAARHGVQVGDSVRLAKRRCPGLEITEFCAENYAERFEQVWSVFARFTPMIETTDLHQGYLDITKDSNRYGGPEAIIAELQRLLKTETGLWFKWGGGTDKWMAWLARGHDQFITPQMESLVLSKLPVESIALSERVTERLHHFDIHTVADLMNLPSGFLESHLGFDREFVLRRLTRHKEPVRANFPSPTISAHVDISDQDDQCIERAVALVARDLYTQLNAQGMQASSLALVYRKGKHVHKREHKLASVILSPARLERIIHSELPKEMRTALRQISITAKRLLPAMHRQDTLWGDQGKPKREDAIERVQMRLQSRYGTQTIMSGSTALEQQRPRFAQLVYQTRGLSLP
jgi:nucleotidyltransferase/DNA polymerase involved in DNA repair